jgi:Tat protein secretion system quality control protein TatD with DNase activity
MANGLLRFIDTHCHIHDDEFSAKYDQPVDEIIADAKADGVDTLICVGTDVRSSEQAVTFASLHHNCYNFSPRYIEQLI